MNAAVQQAWIEFLMDKFSEMDEWIEEFDESLVGRGGEFALEEEDIDELATQLEEIYNLVSESGLL